VRFSDSERGRGGDGPLKGVGGARGEFGAGRADVADGEADGAQAVAIRAGARTPTQIGFAFGAAL